MFLGRDRKVTFVDQWKNRRLNELQVSEYDKRINLLHTVGFLNLFLQYGNGLVSVDDYGELQSQVIVASIVEGVKSGEIYFNWRTNFDKDRKLFGIDYGVGCIIVFGDQSLSDVELGKNKPGGENCNIIRDFGTSIYKHWRQI